MTFRDRIRNSREPVNDVSNMFKEVMLRVGMEIGTGIENVVESNKYYRLRDYLKTGKRCENIITAMIVTTAIEIGIKPVSTPIIIDKVREVLSLDIA